MERIVNDLVGYEGLKIVQNKNYFNFSLESVVLPRFCEIRSGKIKIMDLCTGNAPIPLVLSTRTNQEIIGVEVQKADGEKCDRCWKYSTTVGEDKNNPTLCHDCIEALK